VTVRGEAVNIGVEKSAQKIGVPGVFAKVVGDVPGDYHICETAPQNKGFVSRHIIIISK
jgi:hypothetical protein